MSSVVGFSVFSNLPERKIPDILAAQDRVFTHFPELQRRSLVVGETQMEVWGHKGMNERIHFLSDGSLVVVAGMPNGKVVLADLDDRFLSDEFIIPWDGRVIVLRISADGRHWTLWNDWLGSIPVFHARIGQGRIASTLEPVVVSTAGYTPDDFFQPGVVSLLMNGHFISDWTLYKAMKVIPPDSVMQWDEQGFRSKTLWTVEPSQDRWEVDWDDLVDEMHALAHQAVADVLATRSNWILPLSAGLDSRLIAAVGAEIGADFHAYTWGEPETTDVIYSHQIAKTLGIPWHRVTLPKDFLSRYTARWSDLFGSSMHFHGMYQMSFLDALHFKPDIPLINGFMGDQLSGMNNIRGDTGYIIYKNKWYMHWDAEEVRELLKAPIAEALQERADEVNRLYGAICGTAFQKNLVFGSWSRQRLFTSFQSTLASYWRETATPFLNRSYARFALSLPRAVLENRRLLGDVFRRYYGKLAVIPGTYANQPFILTGRYLLKNRIVGHLPAPLHHGPFAGYDDRQLRMDMVSIQLSGKKSLWPLFDNLDRLAEWMDVSLLEKEYQSILRSKDDIRPLRKLQSVQTLAYRLFHWQGLEKSTPEKEAQ
jgi:hypothetical protein